MVTKNRVVFREEGGNSQGPSQSSPQRRARHLSAEEQLYVFVLLKRNRLVGQIWPVYACDKSHPVYGLIVGREMALQELNVISDIQISERQLRTVLKRFAIVEGTSEPEAKAEFYRRRRDRRVT